jgi:hypothetical protein
VHRFSRGADHRSLPIRLPVGLEEPLSTRTPRKVGLPPDHPTLPSILKKAGYRTALIGNGIWARCPSSGRYGEGPSIFMASAAVQLTNYGTRRCCRSTRIASRAGSPARSSRPFLA